MQKRKTTRTVFLVYVVGKRNSGKTAFLQSFVDRYVGSYGKDQELSPYVINAVQVKKQEVYIIVSWFLLCFKSLVLSFQIEDIVFEFLAIQWES